MPVRPKAVPQDWLGNWRFCPLQTNCNGIMRWHVCSLSWKLGENGPLEGNFPFSFPFTQDYSTRKVLERRVKSLTHDPAAISVAPPKLYAKRFLDFITSHLFLAPPGYRTSDTTGGATAGIPAATGTLTTVATASSSVAPTAAVTRQGSTGSTIGSEVVPFPGFGRVSAGAREAGAGVGGGGGAGIGEAGGVDVEKGAAVAVAPLPAVAAIAASERYLVSGAASNGSSGNSPTAEGVPLAVVMSPTVNMKGLSAMVASAPAGEEVVGAQTQN